MVTQIWGKLCMQRWGNSKRVLNVSYTGYQIGSNLGHTWAKLGTLTQLWEATIAQVCTKLGIYEVGPNFAPNQPQLGDRWFWRPFKRAPSLYPSWTKFGIWPSSGKFCPKLGSTRTTNFVRCLCQVCTCQVRNKVGTKFLPTWYTDNTWYDNTWYRHRVNSFAV